MTENQVVPFSEEEKHQVTFDMMQQIAQLVCMCIVNSRLVADQVDQIIGFRKGHTLRILNRCLNWDGKWDGPSLRDIAFIAHACGFRIDFTMVQGDFRIIAKPTMQQQPQAPEGVEYVDGNSDYTPLTKPGETWLKNPDSERSDQEPIDPKNPPVKL